LPESYAGREPTRSPYKEDYRQGDGTLDSMSPPSGGMGERVAVDKYEVAVQIEA